MVESSDRPSLLDRIRSSAYVSKLNPTGVADLRPAPTSPDTTSPRKNHAASLPERRNASTAADDVQVSIPTRHDNVAADTFDVLPPPASSPIEDRQEEAPTAIAQEAAPNFAIRFYHTLKEIIFSSLLNVLLVFVPVGIAVNFVGVSPTVVFALNAVAIIPLAGLLSHATESVACTMGDTVGALMNVTFGNAVELIIFIALVKNEIRIVQASLLGSILANLLLILGMCFLFGGLRFREQIYNSTVTQMSACLLSLSVTSLLLPTAFHASFTDATTADQAVLQVSRGTSVILLLVYVLYLLFQLKSHAYMYESTPQHVIDEESHPGVLADMLGSSSSSDSSNSSGSSDSENSSGSHTTAKRIKRALRGRRRRKSSVSSKDTPSVPSAVRTPSTTTFGNVFDHNEVQSLADGGIANGNGQTLGAIASGDEADTEGEQGGRSLRFKDTIINFRDFETEKGGSGSKSPEAKSQRKSKKKHRKSRKGNRQQDVTSEKVVQPTAETNGKTYLASSRVSFAEEGPIGIESSPKRPFNIRGLSVRPTMPKMLTSTVFSTANPTSLRTTGPPGPTVVPRAPYGLRRTSSLPDRLNLTQSAPPAQPLPRVIAAGPSNVSINSTNSAKVKRHMSRTSAIVLLLISTGLVALCAEFLVSSINYLVENTSVSEEFIGLIVLPIVGNAAEHVTAVTVASKNKMDLAIGVAVGSSIQIALFVTPVIVLLGWILAKDMTLYFSLFETIALFVSAFIVNFLVLDGRSNYLEGALLVAAYIIIAVAAFFYPDSSQQSSIGGASDGMRMLKLV